MRDRGLPATDLARVDAAPKAVGYRQRTPIPWDFLDREVRDGGVYLLLLRVDERKRITVGRLGKHEGRHNIEVAAPELVHFESSERFSTVSGWQLWILAFLMRELQADELRTQIEGASLNSWNLDLRA